MFNNILDKDAFQIRFKIKADLDDLFYASSHSCEGTDLVLGREVQLYFSKMPVREEIVQFLLTSTNANIQHALSSFSLALPGQPKPIFVVVLETANSMNINDFLKTFPNERAIFRIVGDIINGLRDLHNTGLGLGGFYPSQVVIYKDELGRKRAKLTATSLLHPSYRSIEADTAGNIRQNLAPEMVLSPGTSSTQSADIWSLGVLLFEIFTGEYPLSSLQKKDFNTNFESLLKKAIPEPYSTIIRIALKLSPGKRANIQAIQENFRLCETPSGNYSMAI